MATAITDMHDSLRHRTPRLGSLWTLLGRGPGLSRRPVVLAATAAFALGGVLLVWSASKQAFTIELLAAAVLVAAAALCLIGSVPHARAGTTPAGTAT